MSKNSFFQSQIKTPIGNGEYSDSLDIINTRKNLKHINQYNGETDLSFFDKNLEVSIRDFQSKEGLKIDGLMNPGGETERALNRNLRGAKNLISSIRLANPVGTSLSNDSGDVKQVQRSLGRLGFIPPSRGFEANGIIDPVTSKGIFDFQKTNNLKVDGFLLPLGETETTINTRLQQASADEENQMPAAPTGKVEREELPIPNIPNTNIPDHSVLEGHVLKEDDEWKKHTDQGIIIDPNWDGKDVKMVIDPDRNGNIKVIKKKEWDI